MLVDAAAEILTVPNVHLQNGATLVGYSGGKCIRGPQTAGLLLGRKDLVKAAWVHSAPHHGFSGDEGRQGRSHGMLMAVEMWMKRDHDAEWKMWTSWLDSIADRVKTVDGVPPSSSPRDSRTSTPSLKVFWDHEQFGLPVISWRGPSRRRAARGPLRRSAATRPSEPASAMTPYMMPAGDAQIVADRLSRLLSHPPQRTRRRRRSAPAADLSGHGT